MGVQELRELRQLHEENSRLKRLVVALDLARRLPEDTNDQGEALFASLEARVLY